MKEINMDIYKVFDEDKRLCQSQSSSVEYTTNMKYIMDELQDDDHILELGAATGRYTIPLAKKGYQVTVLEYVTRNLEVLKTKIQSYHKIQPMLGNAIDLGIFPDESFDVVLNMGPLYHFPNKADQDLVVTETMRVLKKGGLAFFAFLNNDMVFTTEALLYNKEFLTKEDAYYNSNTNRVHNEPFTFLTISEIRQLMEHHNCEEYKFIGSDGLAELCAVQIDQLSKPAFDAWMKYHFYMCEKPEFLAASHHLLYMTKKK